VIKLESILESIPGQVPIKAEENTMACKTAAEKIVLHW
jgi:hypothetical protein